VDLIQYLSLPECLSTITNGMSGNGLFKRVMYRKSLCMFVP